MSEQEVNTYCAVMTGDNGPGDLGKIEGLARLLAQSSAALREFAATSVAIQENDCAAWTERLGKLKIGALTSELPPLLRDQVGALEEEWASEASLAALSDKLGHLLEPLQQEQESLKRDEKELELEEERLMTLTMFADLLDELLRTQPDGPAVVACNNEEPAPSGPSDSKGEI